MSRLPIEAGIDAEELTKPDMAVSSPDTLLMRYPMICRIAAASSEIVPLRAEL
jgi:hypothetical protein